VTSTVESTVDMSDRPDEAPDAPASPDERGDGAGEERRWPSRRVALAILAVLSLQFLGLSLYEAWHDTPTLDEAVYMSGGLHTLHDHSLRLNNEQPFLPKVVNALPLYLARTAIPTGGTWDDTEVIDGNSLVGYTGMTREFTELHADNLQEVVFVGRLMSVLEGLAIGWVLYALGATLFSRAAGLLAAGAWLTLPLAVGFAHLNSLDLAFALAVAVAALALVRHLRDPSWKTLAVLALAAGALQLTRQTGFVYVGVVCIAVVASRRRDRWAALRDVAVLAVATWGLVWVGTFAVAPHRMPVDQASVDSFLADFGAQGEGLPARAIGKALDVVPWPAEYEVGFETQLAFSSHDSPGYLLGDAWDGTRPSFWPLSMVIKLPITILAMLVAGPLAWRWLNRGQRWRAALVVLLPALAAFAFVLPYNKPIGLRYALPGIVMLLVIASPLAIGLVRRRAGQIVLVVAIVAQLAFLWTSVPHSLAWTAPPFRPGYQVVSESNLDWGQDGYDLVEWLDTHPAYVNYFGLDWLVDKQPGYTALLGTPPEDVTGWVAVSATQLTSYLRDELAWLRGYCNVGTIGDAGTILIYRFDEPPTAEPGPAEPAGRCEGEFSHRV
jgi:Dolichyl-phosphate-mannose-protein mannosyltransferase